MIQASFRFYAELNDFLPADKRQRTFEHTFGDDQSIKHLIEALGVPHPEVDLILINGLPVDFDHLLKDGDRVSVFPIFRKLLVNSPVRPPALAEYRFVLDAHLGRLANYLRMLGFDTLYRNDFEDSEIAEIAHHRDRIVLTRDQGLLKRNLVTHGYWLRETNPRRQLVEILQRFNLFSVIQPFNRCLDCNGQLVSAPKTTVIDRLPAKVRQHYDKFHLCQDCGKLYWEGSHVQRMRQLIEWAIGQAHES